MRIAFHGAAREVTGSCHLIETAAGRMLLDCGMIQGGRERHERNREPFPFDPASIDVVLLSHAHIDHCGRLPLLLRGGFSGPILTTAPTGDLLRILLADAGRIQEEDAHFKRKRLRRRGKNADWVSPLFTEREGLAVLEHVAPVPFDRWVPIQGHGRARFRMAGHILGAAIVQLEVDDGGEQRSVTFSGDLGVEGALLLSAPAHVHAPEVLIMESTYGDRDRRETGDRTEMLFEIVRKTAARGGKVVIPAFAVGRTQEILARLDRLVESGRLALPVYVDSPMAVEATRVFDRFPQAYAPAARRRYGCGDRPLEFPGLHLVTAAEQSKALNNLPGPAVIISASGMCTAGRIKHHLRRCLPDPTNTILFVGYQARGTLGHVIEAGIDPVRIFGEWVRVRADIERIDGFSAHADRGELLSWFEHLGPPPDRTFVVHGDPEAAAALQRSLRDRGASAYVPERGDVFEV